MRIVDRIAGALAARRARVAWGTLPGGESAEALARAGLRYQPVRDAGTAVAAAAWSGRLGGSVGVCVGGAADAAGLAAGLGDANVVALVGIDVLDPWDRALPVLRAVGGRGGVVAPDHVDAQLGRWLAGGPCWIAIPAEIGRYDVADAAVAADPAVGGIPDVAAAVDVARGWKRPLILVGGAARRAGLERLAGALAAPVLTSAAARGVLPEEEGWALGPLGALPDWDAALAGALGDVDGVLAIGWDPAEAQGRWALPIPASAARITLAEPGAEPPPWGGAHLSGGLPALVAAFAERATLGASGWSFGDVAVVRRHLAAALPDAGLAGAVRALRALAGGGDAAVVDAGALSQRIAGAWRCERPDRLLDAPGAGVAAALAVAESGRRCALFVDPRGFERALPELCAAADGDLRLLVVVARTPESTLDPVPVAAALGGAARRVSRHEDLAAAWHEVQRDETARFTLLALDADVAG